MIAPQRLARNITLAAILALFILCIVWEAYLAPIRPGSLLWIKALPLLLPLHGLIMEKRYTYQWTTMFIMLWFIEGVMRAWSDKGTSQILAAIEIVLSLTVLISAVMYTRLRRSA